MQDAAANSEHEAGLPTALRQRILADPGLVLDDEEVMTALLTATDLCHGLNVVDLRDVALARLEERHARMVETHRMVLAAAYENIAGTRRIQRAILALLEPLDFTTFITSLGTGIAATLGVESVRLVLESSAAGSDGDPLTDLSSISETVRIMPPGSVEAEMTGGRNVHPGPIVLRQLASAHEALHGQKAEWIKSEALIRLDLGAGRLPAMLVLGAEDPHKFRPGQGTELLEFFGKAFERILRRWLA